MCPSSCFSFRGNMRTYVVPSFRFSFRGNIRQNHPFGKPPLFIESFRGRPRGGDNFTSLFQVLKTRYSELQKHPFRHPVVRRGHPVNHRLTFVNPRNILQTPSGGCCSDAHGIENVMFRIDSTTTRDRFLQFRGAVSTGGSPLDFFLFPRFYVQFG